MSLFKNVLTARRDGTTERLNAIVHGIYLAKKLNWNFNLRTNIYLKVNLQQCVNMFQGPNLKKFPRRPI
jgi:hypothetical protein